MSKRLRELWLSKIDGPVETELLSEIITFLFERHCENTGRTEAIALVYCIEEREFDAFHWGRRGRLERSPDLAAAISPLLKSRLTPEQLAACTAATINYGTRNHAIS